MKMMMKKKILFCLILICAVFAFTACSLFPEEEARRKTPVIRAAEPIVYRYAAVSRGDLQLIRKISAQYVPVQKEPLRFQMEGEFIDQVFVSVGDTVKAGDVLAQLGIDGVEERIADCQRQLKKLRVQITQLEENRALALKKQALLFAFDPQGLLQGQKQVNEQFDQTLEGLSDSLNVQSVQLAALEDQLARRQVRAPFDGVVSYLREFDDGSVSSLQDTVAVVSDNTMSLFSVSTEYWELLPEGMKVDITVGDRVYETTVTAAETLGQPVTPRESGKKAMVYMVLAAPDAELGNSDQGSFTLLLDERHDVLLIPEEAVGQAGEDSIVYFSTEEGVRDYKVVELGLHADGMYEVISGLTEGEAIILP